MWVLEEKKKLNERFEEEDVVYHLTTYKTRTMISRHSEANGGAGPNFLATSAPTTHN